MVKKTKCSMGRQKIAMEKIMRKSYLQVTFSKRRAGLFKKASELCTLCGVEIAILVFSPAGKTFSFGNPEVDSIIGRFLSRNKPRFDQNKTGSEGDRGRNADELNVYLSHIENQSEFEVKRGEELDEMRNDRKKECWWESAIDELGIEELEQLKNAMMELQKNVTKQANSFLVPFSALDGISGHFDHMMMNIPNNLGHRFGVV